MSDDEAFDRILNGAVPSARGGRKARAGSPLGFSYLRDLNDGDAQAVLNPPPVGLTTSPMTRLRQSHHGIARLMAEGRKQVEIAEITGYSQSRLSILKNDPAFRELVAHYTANKNEIYLDVHARLASLGVDVIEGLHEQYNEDPDSFTKREAMELAQMALDRSVAPPKAGAGGRGFGQGASGGGVNLVINFAEQPAGAPTLEGRVAYKEITSE